MKKHIPNFDNQSVFRFHYIHFGEIGKSYGIGIKELINWTYTPFMIPEKFNTNHAFCVLSYLIKKIECDLNLPECSQKSLTILNNNLDKFGFKLLPDYEQKTVDLYTVTGNMRRFKKSEFYKEYFGWYVPEICVEAVKFIYGLNGYSFEEPNFTL